MTKSIPNLLAACIIFLSACSLHPANKHDTVLTHEEDLHMLHQEEEDSLKDIDRTMAKLNSDFAPQYYIQDAHKSIRGLNALHYTNNCYCRFKGNAGVFRPFGIKMFFRTP